MSHSLVQDHTLECNFVDTEGMLFPIDGKDAGRLVANLEMQARVL